MEIESITYNYEAETLVVTLTDGSVTTYTDREAYLTDWPDREDDCAAIGWA
jgi:hypothetical protein